MNTTYVPRDEQYKIGEKNTDNSLFWKWVFTYLFTTVYWQRKYYFKVPVYLTSWYTFGKMTSCEILRPFFIRLHAFAQILCTTVPFLDTLLLKIIAKNSVAYIKIQKCTLKLWANFIRYLASIKREIHKH